MNIGSSESNRNRTAHVELYRLAPVEYLFGWSQISFCPSVPMLSFVNSILFIRLFQRFISSISFLSFVHLNAFVILEYSSRSVN